MIPVNGSAERSNDGNPIPRTGKAPAARGDDGSAPTGTQEKNLERCVENGSCRSTRGYEGFDLDLSGLAAFIYVSTGLPKLTMSTGELMVMYADIPVALLRIAGVAEVVGGLGTAGEGQRLAIARTAHC